MTHPGPAIRTDIAELYVAALQPAHEHAEASKPNALSFLQLRRTTPPMQGTWQPVMGHIEADETPLETVLREAREELGLDLRSASVAIYALEQSPPYFLQHRNEIVIPPRFAAILNEPFAPTLNHEHDAHRWTTHDPSQEYANWFWPTQRRAALECRELAATPPPPRAAHLRINL